MTRAIHIDPQTREGQRARARVTDAPSQSGFRSRDLLLRLGRSATPSSVGWSAAATLLTWAWACRTWAPLQPLAALVSVALVALWLSRRPGSGLPVRLGPYTLGGKLGEGGMGVVYEARHALLPRPTAIKLLKPGRTSPRSSKRFEREVQLTSLLSHPNTVSVYDCGRASDGTFYYAMEYLDGLDLQTLVEQQGPQEPARVAYLLMQLCGALAEAHSIGLIDRDVKPANIMLCERGGMCDVVKVLDFGLIQDLQSRDAAGMLSETHSIVGTPLYLSPEAITAPETMDGRSDLYAVGAVGYFLLTGAPPFSGNGLVEICANHLHSRPVPPSERVATAIPAEFESLILSCLEKSAQRRPRSAAALQAALAPLAADWTRERAPRCYSAAAGASKTRSAVGRM